MGIEGQIGWQAAAASALAWWEEAGVDMLVDEAARDWLAPAALAPRPMMAPGAEAASASSTPATPSAPATPPVTEGFPADLAAFLAWRAGDGAPEAGWPGDWVAAGGPADAAVMVLVDCPDRGDDAQGLLSGDAGRLFERMLAAIGLAREDVHVAAVCAKRPTAGRAPASVEARLARIASHHVALVAPRRLLLLGDAASRAMLGTGVTQARGRLHRLKADDAHSEAERQTDVVASYHPRFLLGKPAAKPWAWADLQLLIGDSR